MALNAAMSGSILAVPDACFVMIMALPFGSTRALPTDQATLPTGPGLPYARFGQPIGWPMLSGAGSSAPESRQLDHPARRQPRRKL